jgi:hypothetical protein
MLIPQNLENKFHKKLRELKIGKRTNNICEFVIFVIFTKTIYHLLVLVFMLNGNNLHNLWL